MSESIQSKEINLLDRKDTEKKKVDLSTNSEETDCLGLIDLKENAKLGIHPNGAILSLQNQEVEKKPELVDEWKTINYSCDDDLAKLATNLDEVDLVSKNLHEI